MAGVRHCGSEGVIAMNFPLRPFTGLASGLLGVCFCAITTFPVWGLPPSGAGAQLPDAAPDDTPATVETVVVPGPLRSFLRMSGISQEVTPSEVLPMLARNVFLHGFENGKETEFLILIDRYLHQARELQSLAGGDGQIHVADCSDATQLVRVLGYRFEHGCTHSNASLITEDAERAFLTVDSGFPITELEESLEKGTAFTYPFPATPVPVLFSQSDWMALSAWRRTPGANLIDVLLHDEQVGRLYSAMARLEPRTRALVQQSPGLAKLLPVAAAFDFYGSQICIPGHAVTVPGGELAEHSWEQMAGASPRSPGEFVLHLLSRDRGWLAAYFDTLSRLSPEQQRHLAQGERIKDLYDAYRSATGGIVASSGVFPRNAGLLLLLTRLQWQADGQPAIPGSVRVWQEVFARQAHTYGYRDWARRAHSIDTPEHFLDALVASTNMVTDSGPAQAYLMVSAIDSRRAPNQRLSEGTVRLLANRFPEYQGWFLTFSDFPELDDSAIAQFISTADHIGATPTALKANALGAFQADVGLWKILARQNEIPASDLNASWHKMLQPFASANNSNQLFEAARASLNTVITAAGGGANPSQDEIVDLLAGPPQNTPEGERVHEQLADRIRSVLSDQRLASLDTLFALYDGLDSMAHGEHIGDSMLPLAESLHEFEMPRPIFTGGERVAWSPLIYTSRHAELQVQTDLTKVIKQQDHSPQHLQAARGRLTPFLRDTLVGLNYAYYEPPGAQVLHNNPLFVRSHDFSISSVQGVEEIWGAPELIGIGATAGGGAYLMGSLVDLPYALAAAEEDFIAPEKVQALIWRETVPQLLVEAVLPRWWGISQPEMHAAALYQRAGEEILVVAQTDPDVREKVLNIFSARFTIERLEKLQERLGHRDNPNALLYQLLPSDVFYLTAQYRQRFPDQAALGPAGRELDSLVRKDPEETSPERLARDFGAPHPTLTETTDCTLLNREPFPVSGGYSSRLFGESWESSNLYWARLADEMGYSPVMLNVLVPELTHRMVANIFATYVDDWPALLRAMQQTGTEFKQGKLSPQQAVKDGPEGIGSGS